MMIYISNTTCKRKSIKIDSSIFVDLMVNKRIYRIRKSVVRDRNSFCYTW